MKTKSRPSPNTPPTCASVGRFSVAPFVVGRLHCHAETSIPRRRCASARSAAASRTANAVAASRAVRWNHAAPAQTLRGEQSVCIAVRPIICPEVAHKGKGSAFSLILQLHLHLHVAVQRGAMQPSKAQVKV